MHVFDNGYWDIDYACSPLTHFKFVGVLFGGGFPNDKSVFKWWSNIGSITVLFDLSWEFASITFKKGERVIGFLCDSIYNV